MAGFDIPTKDFADWVTKVVKNLPDLPKDTIVLFGYLNDDQVFTGKDLGDETKRTRYRLYLNLQLDEYLVIQKADIIWDHHVPEGFYTPIGGNLLWVQPGAKMQYVRTRASSTEVQASFLQGPMTAGGAGNLGAAGGQPGGGGGLTVACGGGGLTVACGGGGLTVACGGGGLTVACGGGGLTVACGGGGLTVACGGGGLTVACGGGGLTVACGGGGISLGCR